MATGAMSVRGKKPKKPSCNQHLKSGQSTHVGELQHWTRSAPFRPTGASGVTNQEWHVCDMEGALLRVLRLGIVSDAIL